MQELLRSNNLVLISFVETLLRQANIAHLVLDGYTSAIEGSVGALPRRVLVDGDQFERAKQLLTSEGLANELRPHA
jgi:hypothetical protein